ncbi:uncharacterized protein Dwil_GK20577 [Drosophila willistoni]|uniref:GK20577 n=1 Tax=Drosophila willistoni TaxID=7260 RepID=B4N5H0_DROWI|nr:uncharacterized protein LOC6645777 [Drosophila willistoni]EDW79609.1 uncharacterized protein Dwil_GK20577 [Drosophila willistoni]
MYSPKHLIVLAAILVQFVASIHGGTYNNEDHWVYLDKTTDIPDGTVLGGFDSDGYYNYVGRVLYSSAVLPARVVPELSKATYNTETLGNVAATYEVLVANETVSYEWIRSYDGYREKNAVSVGTDATNNRVFICRAISDQGLFIGTLYLAKRACIIKYESYPLRTFAKYEILIRKRKVANFMPFNLEIENH